MKKPCSIFKIKPCYLSLLTVLCVSLFTGFLHAQALPVQPSPYPLNKQIQDLVAKTIPNAQFGMMVMDAKSGRILYQHNGYEHFTPASTTKLLTAAASLYYLKPDFRYATTVYIDKKTPLHAELKGNVYIKFSGDPSLTQYNLETLIQKIHAKGIKKIQGNIILDTSTFSGPSYPQGMTLRDIQWSYGAPVTSIIINRNGVPISISPSDTLRQPVNVTVSGSDKAFFPLQGNAITVTYPDAENSCEFDAVMSDQNKINVTGCWPIDTPAYKKLAVMNPTLFATQIIKNGLKKSNMQLTGVIKTGLLPKHHTLIAQHLSNPLSSLVSHMLRFSDNLYANAFLKTLGARTDGEGNFFNGLKVLKSILAQHTDINFNQMVLFDGAGISNYNLITPYQLNQLLYAVYHSPKIKGDFLHALAVPDEHGTLVNRMHAFGLSKNIHAKTGSMTGVSTLAGYLTTETHHTLLFAMMANNYVGSISKLRTLEDQLVSLLRNTSVKPMPTLSKH